MNRKSRIFLITILSLFFLCGLVSAEYSNDVPAPTVVIPPKTSTPPPPPPPPAPKEPEKPPVKITVPTISGDYETGPAALVGATVIVRVLESETKKAIAGAAVKWYGAKYATGGVTDSRGEAKIGQVIPGDAKITASARGYDTNTKTVRAKSSTKVQYFDIFLNKSTKTVPSAEIPGATVVTPTDRQSKASIRGIVYDKATKKPISGAAVKLTGTGPAMGITKDVSSGEHGAYEITDCPLGVAVKLIYSKESYNKEEMTRYIAKTATSYRQDAYLGKGAAKAEKPGKEKSPAEMVEKRSPAVQAQTDLEVVEFLISGKVVRDGLVLKAGNYIHPVSVTVRNNGPDEGHGLAGMTTSKNGASWGDEEEADIKAPLSEKRISQIVRVFTPEDLGRCRLEATVTPPAGDVDSIPANNIKGGTITLIKNETDVELTSFTVEGQPVQGNPVIGVGDGRLNFHFACRNNGPNNGSGISIVYFQKHVEEPPYMRGANIMRVGSTYEFDISFGGFEAGRRYDLRALVYPGVEDTDSIPRNNEIHGTLTVAEGPSPTNGDAPYGEPGSYSSDLEIVSFTINGQPVVDNARIPLINGTARFVMELRNNGPARGTSTDSALTMMFLRSADDGNDFINIQGANDLSEVSRIVRWEGMIDGVRAGLYSEIETLLMPAENGEDGSTVDSRHDNNNTRAENVEFVADGAPGNGQAGQHETNLEMVSFTIQDAPVQANPRVELPADGNININVRVKNKGRDEATAPSELFFVKFDGQRMIALIGPIPLDLQGRPGRIVEYTNREPAAPGIYHIASGITPGEDSQDFEPDLGDNVIEGDVTIVARDEDADAGPDGGQPDAGQPDNGQPDDGQPGGGQPPQPGGIPSGGWNPPGDVIPGGAGPGGPGPIGPAIPPQPDAGLFGGGGVPQAMPAPVGFAKAPIMDTAQPSPVVHPQMGSGPEFVKEFFEQAMTAKTPEAKEEKEAEEPAAEKEKNKISWLIALLSGIGLFIIFAVIAKKKKKKNGV